MRRAAVQAFRTARRQPVRKLLGGRSFFIRSPNHGLGLRLASSTSRRNSATHATLHSSMLPRSLSAALITGIVASGAWYAYKGDPSSVASLNPKGTRSISTASPQAQTANSANVYSATPDATPATFAEEAAQSTRRALVVDNDQFYTGSIVGDEPLSKFEDDSGRKVLEMLTPEQATERLRRNEESYLVGRGRGVVRYDVVQLPSNNPIEDDHAEKIVEVPQSVAATGDGTSSSDWMFWGVFDGHRYEIATILRVPLICLDSGWTTSAKLRQVLISFVARELNATYKAALSDPTLTLPTPESIDAAIKTGFVRLDNEIVHESVQKTIKANSKRVAAELLAPALSGSCALLSFYDSKSKMLRVACTGDSRAVLGRRGASGKWVATPLSEDQTGGTPSEVERVRKEHPNEEHVVRNGRMLGGLEPSRAFGDAFYKWTRETQDRLKRSFFGRTPSPLLKTPPYVTAEPIITTTQVNPEKGDFLVMATDGLWEMLTNEEVVGLVGQWIESQASSMPSSKSPNASWLGSWFAFSADKSLPVEKESKNGQAGQRQPIRQQQYQVPETDQRFVVEDKNAATHLIRNALGGKDRDMVCALLTLPSPYSRRYR
jgi:pyruvate dehydrogenase phosphatase